MSPCLPTEIAERVIDFLCEDQDALRQCALASRALTARCQFYLFRRFNHATFRDEKRLADLTCDAPHLAKLITILYVDIFITLDAFPILPNLRVVHMHGKPQYGLLQVPASLFNKIRVSTPALVDVRISYGHLDELDTLVQLLHTRTSITSLALDTVAALGDPIERSLVARPMNLNHLKIVGADDLTLSYLWTHFIGQLSSTRALSLRRLDIEITASTVFEANYALSSMEALQDLRIIVLYSPPREGALDLSHNNVLQSLAFSVELYGAGSRTAHDVSFISASCQTVASPDFDHLSLRMCIVVNSSMDEFKNLGTELQRPEFKRLKDLDITISTDRVPEFAQIFRPLVDKGIHVHVADVDGHFNLDL
ncbi:hypothetical protein PUNSTDRAFT_133905 [Punctularia strigosozonata HHB-11173 SS5]|uniref:uncharacterized protein n=1 Tax=Punctularia strigosozonata (strain HHB-11173) TaxID=741275 RepID=UPI00044184BE|nr:uncharacterized protein PUNSTDRAFT_133905 [Punctularia strigosozonata HHB-11173 SS5]EIN08719.1 hypothetical protein PUNSTDRAFT_133905 [Punctularia strigosozonata HHB-11173 SS5]